LNSILEAAHAHCSGHREEIERSDLCGCFYCMATFAPSEIVDWIDAPDDADEEAGTTALCPRCGIDSVIGSASGYPIDADFLTAMHAEWF
jgi:hypothetical protein